MEDVTRRLAALDLNLLVSLHALIRLRSVTQAASHLSVTQSTMSHQLARLRDMFEDPLFVRRGHEMVPTSRALAVERVLAVGLKAFDDVVRAPEAFDPTQAEGEVVFATADWASTQYGPLLAQLFQAEAPGLRVRIEPLEAATIEERLDWDVDLAVMSQPSEPDPESGVVMSHDHFVGVADPGHPFVAEPPTVESWRQASWVGVADAILGPEITGRVTMHQDPARRAIGVAFYLALPSLLRGSDRIASLPSYVAWGLAHDHGLGTFPLPVATPPFPVSLRWSPLRAREPRIVWLRDRILDLVREEIARRAQILTVPGPAAGPTAG